MKISAWANKLNTGIYDATGSYIFDPIDKKCEGFEALQILLFLYEVPAVGLSKHCQSRPDN